MMTATLRQIGSAIRDGSTYLPIRNRAAALAATAAPKDYVGQVKAIYDDFCKRWRYVKDPVGNELVTRSPRALYELVMGGKPGSPAAGLGLGVGDCDDATCAIGAQLQAIGMPVRLGVTAPPGMPAGPVMTHVFAQTLIPKMGWVTVDPVLYPKQRFGEVAKHSRIAYYDLDGRFLGRSGNAIGLSGTGAKEMNGNQFVDYGLAGVDARPAGQLPIDMRRACPYLNRYGRRFGDASEMLGIIDAADMPSLPMAEVEIGLGSDGQAYAWTPAIEMAPEDYEYVRRTGRIRDGAIGLGDNGVLYKYDGLGGFFKKLFRRIGRGVKRVVKGVGRIGKKILSKLPGGKYLIRLGSKIWKISKKLLRPLTKLVGKYAAKLAPIAAIIPGYGTAIAAGLYAAGKIANIMNATGTVLKGAKGTLRKLKFKSPKHSAAFRKALHKEAKKEIARQKVKPFKPIGHVRPRTAVGRPPVFQPVRSAVSA
jgi:hypothetical protein